MSAQGANVRLAEPKERPALANFRETAEQAVGNVAFSIAIAMDVVAAELPAHLRDAVRALLLADPVGVKEGLRLYQAERFCRAGCPGFFSARVTDALQYMANWLGRHAPARGVDMLRLLIALQNASYLPEDLRTQMLDELHREMDRLHLEQRRLMAL